MHYLLDANDCACIAGRRFWLRALCLIILVDVSFCGRSYADEYYDVNMRIIDIKNGTLQGDDIKALTHNESGEVLSLCALNDDVICLDKVLGAGVSPNVIGPKGVTPLIVAIGADGAKAAKRLVEAGADTEKDTPRGSAAQYAIAAGSPEMVRIVLGSTPEAGNVLMERAGAGGDPALLRAALALGADPDAPGPYGATPLMLAIAAGSHEVAEALLANGAKPGTVGSDGTGPLSIAILKDDVKALGLLVAAGADPNRAEAGMLPLELAALRGDPAVVEALLKAGADPERRSAEGIRPADFALAIGQTGIADRLGGASVRSDERLFAAIEAKSLPDLTAALEAGADPNARDKSGNPAIVVVAGMGGRDLLEALDAAGADLLAQGSGGASVLHAALSIEDAGERRETTEAVLRLATKHRQDKALLILTDETERSGAVTLAARAKAASIDGQWVDATFLSAVNDKAMRSVALVADHDGVSPFVAAALADNFQMTFYFVQSLGLYGAHYEGVSLQDIARAQKNWAALAALPEDRALPDGLGLGASKTSYETAKKEMQRRLKAWGYYSGSLDGVVGAGTRAALFSLYQDRGEEIVGMARALAKPWSSFLEVNPADANPGDVILDASVKGLSMAKGWTVIRWKPPLNTSTVNFAISARAPSAAASNVEIENSVSYVESDANGSEILRIGRQNGSDIERLE